MSKRRVVITGLGIISPVGSTVESAWQNVLAGKSGIGPIKTFDVSAFPVRFHGPVADFDAEKYLPAKELRRMDPFMHYGYAAAIEAFKDSAITVTEANSPRIGVAMGAGISLLPEYTRSIRQDGVVYRDLAPPGMSKTLAMIKRAGQGGLADAFCAFTVERLALPRPSTSA